jgi:hypothetical protein
VRDARHGGRQRPTRAAAAQACCTGRAHSCTPPRGSPAAARHAWGAGVPARLRSLTCADLRRLVAPLAHALTGATEPPSASTVSRKRAPVCRTASSLPSPTYAEATPRDTRRARPAELHAWQATGLQPVHALRTHGCAVDGGGWVALCTCTAPAREAEGRTWRAHLLKGPERVRRQHLGPLIRIVAR